MEEIPFIKNIPSSGELTRIDFDNSGHTVFNINKVAIKKTKRVSLKPRELTKEEERHTYDTGHVAVFSLPSYGAIYHLNEFCFNYEGSEVPLVSLRSVSASCIDIHFEASSKFIEMMDGIKRCIKKQDGRTKLWLPFIKETYLAAYYNIPMFGRSITLVLVFKKKVPDDLKLDALLCVPVNKNPFPRAQGVSLTNSYNFFDLQRLTSFKEKSDLVVNPFIFSRPMYVVKKNDEFVVSYTFDTYRDGLDNAVSDSFLVQLLDENKDPVKIDEFKLFYGDYERLSLNHDDIINEMDAKNKFSGVYKIKTDPLVFFLLGKNPQYPQYKDYGVSLSIRAGTAKTCYVFHLVNSHIVFKSGGILSRYNYY